MSDLKSEIALLKQNIKEYPDFPRPGVLFRDIFSVFQKPELLPVLRDVLVTTAKQIQPPVECIVGVDARGFLLGPLLALELQLPFVPIRKKGKLPGKVVSASYALEYGQDRLEVQEGSIRKGQAVLVVDDLLATGGSLSAACELVQQLEARVASCLVIIELKELKGRDNVPARVVSIIEY